MTTALFSDGVLVPDACGSALLAEVLERAGDRGGAAVRSADLVASLLCFAETVVGDAVRDSLTAGANPRDLLDAIDVFAPPSVSLTAFDGRRDRFAPSALAALEALEARLESTNGDAGSVAVELFMVSVLKHLDERDRAGLGVLDIDATVRALERRVQAQLAPALPLLDAATGRLRSEEFASSAWSALQQAAVRAGELGYDRVLPPHVFLAMLAETEGPAEQMIRLQGLPNAGPVQVTSVLTESFRLSQTALPPPELDRHGLGDGALRLLEAGQRQARLAGDERVATGHLLVALLDDPPPRLRSTLEGAPLGLDLTRMRQRAGELARVSAGAPRETAFRLPHGLLPSEDLTFRARTDGLPEALHADDYLEPMLRALSRRTQNNVLITGAHGVGATALVHELARRAASGAVRALARKRVLWVNCADVAAEDSREKLLAIITHVAGRTDIITCLDGLGPILRGPSGDNHKGALRAALAAGRAQVVAVMSSTDFQDLLAADPQLRDLFTRVDIGEQAPDRAAEIVALQAATLGEEHGVTIEPLAVRRAIVLTADYLMAERLPAKAIRVLRRACEDAEYARAQHDEEIEAVTVGDVLRVVSEFTGVPVETLGGVTAGVDYAHELSRGVVGQPEAVRTVAAELRKIKAGVGDPGRPAAVMLFAGLTGTGKTELAKTLAGLYSTSRRLQTYTMENFTEPHAISGIVGVPPGYVGHDQGGRLINDLNADPYGVFLIDEAEKAHPDVLKPFLNLFDEGWVVDQRGVKAYADRAIFVLTSNVGQEIIARETSKKTPAEEIAALVRAALAAERHERSGQLVFPPEFLARIGRILIFRPLDQQAMHDICAIALRRAEAGWLRREKRLVVDPALAQRIAEEAHARDRAAGFHEGGRIVRRLVEDLVQAPITDAAEREPEAWGVCEVIEVYPVGSAVEVRLSAEPGRSCAAALAAEAEVIRGLVARGAHPDVAWRSAEAALSRLQDALGPETESRDLTDRLRSFVSELELVRERSQRDGDALLASFAAELEGHAQGGGDDG